MNEKSRQMAEGRTFLDLFTVRRPVEGEGYSNRSRSPNSIALTLEEKKKNAAQVNSFINRNYEKERKKKDDREKKAWDLKEEENRLAKENATPQISLGSQKIVSGKIKM